MSPTSGFATKRQQLSNVFWLLTDNFYRLGVGFIVSALIARTIGPKFFGVLNYSTAVIGIFSSVASLGMNGVVVKELIERRANENIILSASLINQLFGSILACFLVLLMITIFREGERDITLCVMTLLPAIFFRSSDSIKYWYESNVNNRVVVVSQIVSFTVYGVICIAVVVFSMPFHVLPLAVTIQAFISAMLLLYNFKRNNSSFLFVRYGLLREANELLQKSWPLVFSGLALMLYMRIDQIMIGSMLGDSEVGVYSVATKLIEVWFFIPGIICSSLFPNIIKSKYVSAHIYKVKLQRLYNLLVVIALVISVFAFLLSEPIILFVYGDKYSDAITVVKIFAWVNVFYFLSSSSGRWFINEGLQRLALFRSCLGVFCSVMFNYILIPMYGMNGAAIGTLMTYIVTSYLSDFLNPKTREQFYMKSKSFLVLINIKDAVFLLKGKGR